MKFKGVLTADDFYAVAYVGLSLFDEDLVDLQVNVLDDNDRNEQQVCVCV